MPTLDDLRLVDRVRKVISRGPLFWYIPQEIIAELQEEERQAGEKPKWRSDSGITARCRDLRKPEYGGHLVNARKRSGSGAWEYQLVQPAEQTKAA